MIVFPTVQDAICNIAKSNNVKRIHKRSGMMNQGIYEYKNRIYKATFYNKEAKACSILLGKKFKNVVKIHAVHRVYIDNQCLSRGHKYVLYVIEQEKLIADKSIQFGSFNVEEIMTNNSNRIGYIKSIFDAVLNAYVELDSVGIIYRDLHGWNIMKDAAGRFKLIDFGCVTIRRE